MTHLPISDTPARMGRPPLIREKKDETVTTVIRLTKDVRARIEAVAGPNKMSEFVREAIDAELARREKAR